MTRDYAKNNYKRKKSLHRFPIITLFPRWLWLILLLLFSAIIAGGVYLYNYHPSPREHMPHTMQMQQVTPPAFEFRTIKSRDKKMKNY